MAELYIFRAETVTRQRGKELVGELTCEAESMLRAVGYFADKVAGTQTELVRVEMLDSVADHAALFGEGQA